MRSQAKDPRPRSGRPLMLSAAVPLLSAAALLLLAPGCAPRRLHGAVRAGIARAMVAKRSPLAACYKAALKRDRTLAGRIMVNFTVRPDGSFSPPTVSNSGVSDGKFASCVESTLQGMRVAARPDRAVIVTYPISFSPSPVP